MKRLGRGSAAAAIAAAVCMCAPANAFRVTAPGHQAITHVALQDVTTLHPFDGFTEDAIEAIVRANLSRDIPWNYRVYQHFDDETFQLGGTSVIRLRQEVVALLLAGFQENAWRRLGYATHGVQDFYAHSNWVEARGEDDRPRHFDTTVDTDAKRIANFIADVGEGFGAGCNRSGVIPDNAAGITTAYYNKTINLITELPYSPNPHVEQSKCIHLGPTVFVTGDPNDLECSRVPCLNYIGMEKDSPDKPEHSVARLSAVEATTELVQGIVDELQALDTPEGYQAICLLFGQTTSLCNAPAREPGDGVYRFRNMCVYGLEGVHSDTSLNVNGNRSTTTMDQLQRACIETSNLIVTPHVLFCKRAGQWMPKRSVSRHREDGRPEHILEVREDGTFIGIQKVDHDTVTAAGSRNRLLLNVVAKANPTTHQNEGSFRRIEHRFGPNSGGREETWFGYGAGSGGVNPGSEYFVELDLHGPLTADMEPPSYCYDLDDKVPDPE